MKRWKRLANVAMDKIRYIIRDRKITLEIKLRAFNAYVAIV